MLVRHLGTERCEEEIAAFTSPENVKVGFYLFIHTQYVKKVYEIRLRLILHTHTHTRPAANRRVAKIIEIKKKTLLFRVMRFKIAVKTISKTVYCTEQMFCRALKSFSQCNLWQCMSLRREIRVYLKMSQFHGQDQRPLAVLCHLK